MNHLSPDTQRARGHPGDRAAVGTMEVSEGHHLHSDKYGGDVSQLSAWILRQYSYEDGNNGAQDGTGACKY